MSPRVVQTRQSLTDGTDSASPRGAVRCSGHFCCGRYWYHLSRPKVLQAFKCPKLCASLGTWQAQARHQEAAKMRYLVSIRIALMILAAVAIFCSTQAVRSHLGHCPVMAKLVAVKLVLHRNQILLLPRSFAGVSSAFYASTDRSDCIFHDFGSHSRTHLPPCPLTVAVQIRAGPTARQDQPFLDRFTAISTAQKALLILLSIVCNHAPGKSSNLPQERPQHSPSQASAWLP